jgi:hypothetical protein
MRGRHVEDRIVAGAPFAHERGRLGDLTDQRECVRAKLCRRPTGVGRGPLEREFEHAVVVPNGHQTPRAAGRFDGAFEVRQQVCFGFLGDPVVRIHRGLERLCIRQESPRTDDAVASLVGVPASPIHTATLACRTTAENERMAPRSQVVPHARDDVSPPVGRCWHRPQGAVSGLIRARC